RNHFVAAHGITRNILSGYLQTSPETLSFSVEPNGKPALSRKTDSLDLRFNLSHSHGLAMLALALGREVGIDVERIRPGIADEGIQAHIFTAHEQAEFQHIVPTERDCEFLRRWTCKEAFVKALGDGLQIPLNSFEVSFATSTSPVLRGPGCEPWNLFSFPCGDEYMAALVVEGKTTRLKFWDWSRHII
ncbi:MAG: 4'-phosphopantetheinyl transferase superfamily protein, partial [Candidatus Acidiferrum sp.]